MAINRVQRGLARRFALASRDEADLIRAEWPLLRHAAPLRGNATQGGLINSFQGQADDPARRKAARLVTGRGAGAEGADLRPLRNGQAVVRALRLAWLGAFGREAGRPAPANGPPSSRGGSGGTTFSARTF